MKTSLLLTAAFSAFVATAAPAGATVVINNSVTTYDRDGNTLFHQSGSANILSDLYAAVGYADAHTPPAIEAYVEQSPLLGSGRADSMLQYNFYVGCAPIGSCSVRPGEPLVIPILINYSLFANAGSDFSDASSSIDVADGLGSSFHAGLACSSDGGTCGHVSGTDVRFDFLASYIDGDGNSRGSTTGTITMRAHASGVLDSRPGRGWFGDAGVDPTLVIDPTFLLDHPDFTLTIDDVQLGDAVGGGVPEPSTWAMMLTGFVGLGATLRRRRVLSRSMTA